MAEALYNEKFKDRRDFVEASSFGIYPQDNQANEKTLRVLKEVGIDYSHFIPSGIIDNPPKDEDLLLTMSISQKEYLLNLGYENVFTLKEYVDGEMEDIVDPFGGSIEEYRFTRDVLMRLIEAIPYGIE